MVDSASVSPQTNSVLSSSQRLPVVYVEGSHYDMGRQIGLDRRDEICRMLSVYQRYFEEE